MEPRMEILKKKSKVKVEDKSKYSLKLILPNPYLIWYHRQQPISLLIIDTEKERQTSSQFVANIRSHCELMLMDGIQKSRIKGSLSRYKFFIRFFMFFYVFFCARRIWSRNQMQARCKVWQTRVTMKYNFKKLRALALQVAQIVLDHSNVLGMATEWHRSAIINSFSFSITPLYT